MKTEIEELKRKLEEMKNRHCYEYLVAMSEIVELEKQEAESDDIVVGGFYYNMFGHCIRWIDSETDNFRRLHGLVFRTYKAYEQWSKWTQIDVRVKKAIREGEKMFEAEIKRVYYIFSDLDINYCYNGIKGTHFIETTSEKSAEHVIKTIGVEDLDWYFKNRIK